ncbi:GNAT family N-acetyltransferase [Nocardioides psychrotolerans]|uniref:GNAT family N-acetyltransferase n=1 Tax=Nocardioides psychrotolerans TaxID=1005945 RepID=UPI00313789DC
MSTPPLPRGLTTRSLTLEDVAPVLAVMVAEEQAELGRVETDEADILGDWQRPSVDLARTTVGVLDGEALVAYAEMAGADVGYANVHPEHHRRGIGTWLAAWLVAKAREEGSTVIGAQLLEGGSADRLLASLGWEPRWTAWDLTLPEGAEIAAQPLPPGYALRDLTPDDHVAVWTLLEDAFLEWSDRERQSLEDFASRVWLRPGTEPWHLRVVTDAAGEVVGATHVFLAGEDGYVNKIGVRPDQRGLGLARSMLADAFAAARAHGAARSNLATDSRTGALGLYERVGMVVTSTWVNRAISTTTT